MLLHYMTSIWTRANHGHEDSPQHCILKCVLNIHTRTGDELWSSMWQPSNIYHYTTRVTPSRFCSARYSVSMEENIQRNRFVIKYSFSGMILKPKEVTNNGIAFTANKHIMWFREKIKSLSEMLRTV